MLLPNPAINDANPAAVFIIDAPNMMHVPDRY
jgi:hypothetical protein